MLLTNLLIFILFIIFFYNIECQYNENKDIFIPIHNDSCEFEAVFRIDSLYNKYSLATQEDNLFFIDLKNGINLNFLITTTFYNSYFIISKLNNKKIGVDNENKLHMYNINDKENIEKTYWNIIKYNPNIYLIQNVFNQKYLEIKPINNKLRCKNSYEYDPINKIDNVESVAKFYFLKLYQEVQIRPIDIEMLNKEPIDIFMKYTDYTDKALNRTGINEKIKEKDMEEIKYSIRSILKYIPWIRKIFIVMPNDKVRFLKPIEEIKDKFVYIKEKDLIGFDTLNSAPLQFNLFKLEKYGISENFIYMDDNYFIGGYLKKIDFFYYDSTSKKVVPSIINNYFNELNKEECTNEYNELLAHKDSFNSYDFYGWKLSLLSSQKLFIDNYDISLINVEFTHTAVPLNINDLKEIHNLIITKYQYVNEVLYSHERNIFNLQPQVLFSLYGLNIKKRKVHSIQYNHLGIEQIHFNYLYSKLIGINTGGNEYTISHEKGKIILASRFNFPHKYEIDFKEDNKNIIKEEEEESTYINKTELNIIEELFKKQLTYYVIIYYILIIGISIVIIALIYYLFYKNKDNYFCLKYSYDE